MHVKMPLWKINCPACDLRIYELTPEALSRSLEKHIKICDRFTSSKKVLRWKKEGIIDEMITIMIRDLITDNIQQTFCECDATIDSPYGNKI